MSEREPIPKGQPHDACADYLSHQINTVQSRIAFTQEQIATMNKLRILKRRSLKRILKRDEKSLQELGLNMASYELAKIADAAFD